VLARWLTPSVPFTDHGDETEAFVALPAQTSAAIMTVEEFMRCDVADGKAELIRGELRVTSPPGAPHGTTASNLVFSCEVAEIFEGIGPLTDATNGSV